MTPSPCLSLPTSHMLTSGLPPLLSAKSKDFTGMEFWVGRLSLTGCVILCLPALVSSSTKHRSPHRVRCIGDKAHRVPGTGPHQSWSPTPFFTGAPCCISQLLLCIKSPQNLALKMTAILFAHNSVGQKFGLGSARQFFCWSYLMWLQVSDG